MGLFDSIAPFATLALVIGGGIALGPFGAIAGGIVGGLLTGALAQQTATPSPAARSERRLAQIADANMPYTYTYGLTVAGYSRAWSGIGGSRNKWKGLDGILDDGPCTADPSHISEWAVKLNDDYFKIVDSDPGSGEALMLNSNGRVEPTLPWDWLVPIHSSKYWRVDQSDKSPSGKEWHFAIKIFFDNHPRVNDAQMVETFGTPYSKRNRWYQSKTGFHAITRANTEIGTPPSGPFNLVFLVRGRSNLFDWRTNDLGWTNNAALVFADQVKKRFKVGNEWFDSNNMIEAANSCADASWDSGTPPQIKYQVNDQFRDDEADLDVLQRIAAHFGGWFFERGDKIILATGKARPNSMTLTPADFAADDHVVTPLREEDWFNTVIPSCVPRFTGTGDLHGKMTPVGAVTRAAYVAEDKGEVIEVDRAYEVPFGRHAQYLALRELKQRRLAIGSGGAANYSGTFKMRAFPLEIGDVVAIANPDLWLGTVQWQIIDKTLSFENWTVALGFIRYDAEVENPEGIPHDEPLGEHDPTVSGILPIPQGLSASVVPGSGVVGTGGRIFASAQVSWQDPDSIFVDTGSILVAWKPQGTNWPGQTLSVDGQDSYAVIPNLHVGDPIVIRAATVGFFGQRSEWSSELIFTPSDNGTLFEPEGTALTVPSGTNLVSDPRFLYPYDNTLGDGVKVGTYVLTSSVAGSQQGLASQWDGSISWDTGIFWAPMGVSGTSVGYIKVVEGIGFWSVVRNSVTIKTSLEMSLSGNTNDTQRVNVLEYIPVRSGQIIGMGATVMFGSVGQLDVRVLFYDANRTFIANGSFSVVSESAAGHASGAWSHIYALQVVKPIGGIEPAFARMQLKQTKFGSNGVQEKVWVDGLEFFVQLALEKPYNPDGVITINRTGDQHILCHLGGPVLLSGGVDPGFWSNGQNSVQVQFSADVQSEVVVSGGAAGVATWAEFWIQAVDVTSPPWTPNTDYDLGDLVRWHGASDTPFFRTYRCDTAGRSGANNPLSTATQNIVDGTARWDYLEQTRAPFVTPIRQKAANSSPNVGGPSQSQWYDVHLSPRISPAILGEGARELVVIVRMTPGANALFNKITIKDIRLSYRIDETIVTPTSSDVD